MDKQEIVDLIQAELREQLRLALIAADEAHATATDKENVAENKYDTLGLEAAYLAHGQSERVARLVSDLQTLADVSHGINPSLRAGPGALVQLEDDSGEVKHLFLAPVAGGLAVHAGGRTVTVVTPEAPLGRALSGAGPDDEVTAEIAGRRLSYLVTGLW